MNNFWNSFRKKPAVYKFMQKNVIRNLCKEGQGFDEIQKQLDKKFGEQAYKRTTIYSVMQEVKLDLPPEEESSHHEYPIDEQLLYVIQQEIEKNEFFFSSFSCT